jgi:hypothetical protein
MDHIVTSCGEQTTCPDILPCCFVQGDPIRDWYHTKPDEVHTFVTTDVGCWARFKTLLRARFKPDLGVLQFEADDYRRKPGESWTALGIKKYRLLKRAYDGATEANIISKIKATMDMDVVRYCKEKNNIDLFIGELMDFDRTMPVARGNFRRGGIQENRNDARSKPVFPQYSMMNSRYDAPVPQNSQAQSSRPIDKGKGTDRSSLNRKDSIQNRVNPETGKAVRSYLNYQGKPVIIKRPCNLCEKNGLPNQMHFNLECTTAVPRAHAAEADEEDELAEQLYRRESGNLISYNFQHAYTHAGAIYHEDDEEDDSESGNGFGGR